MRRVVLLAACAAGVLGWAESAAAQEATQSPARTSPNRAAGQASRSDVGQRAAPTRQDVNASSATEVGEVVVTAASRSDTVQHAPVPVTAFTDERRNLLGIENARDITNLTPSMSLQGEYLTLRGVGRYELPGVGVDPGVAVHVDGVYTSSPAYLNQPDFIADRIEVFPGPNTVFGHNAVGGTVNVYSRRPTPTLHADLRAGYTSEDESYLQAAISGPITDTLGYRFAYAFSHYPNNANGSQTNLANSHDDPNTGDSRLYQAQIEWAPTKDFDLWFGYQGYSSNQSGAYGVQTFLGGGVGLASPYLTGTPANYTTNLFYGLAPNPQYGLPGDSNPQLRDKFSASLDDVGYIDLKNDHTFTINASWNLPGATLKYIGGYQQYDYYSLADADYTARKYMTSPGGRQVPSEYTDFSLQKKKWYSNEIYLTSPSDQRLRWIVGLYQYDERYHTNYRVQDPLAAYLGTPVCASYLTTGCAGTTIAGNPSRSFYNQTTALHDTSQAVYAQLDYDLTKHVRLTGFLRENRDQRYGSNYFREIYDLYGIYGDYGLPQVGLDVTPAVNTANATNGYSDWTGKIGVEWRPDNSMTAYASISKGYKSGGFNLANFVPVLTVKPERLYDYEFGVKKTWGSTLLVDAAAYYYDYRDLQVPVTLGTETPPIPGVSPGGLIYATALQNAQKTRSVGLELQAVWSPVRDLHLTFVYSYLSSQFIDFTGLNGAVINDPATGVNYANLDGNTVPQSPKNKFSFVPQYVFHIANSDLSVSATYSFVDRQYYAVFNTPEHAAPSYYNLDLRAVLQPKNSHFTAILFARNVTNRTQYIFFGPSGFFPSQSTYTVYEPRSFGIELQYRL